MRDEAAITRDGAETPDSRLLAEWSLRHRAALTRYFQRRMPPGADREDLVQEVFLRLARREGLTGIEMPERYLFQAAANVLRDWRRRRLSHATDAHYSIGESVEDETSSPERTLIGKDQLRAMIDALQALPERTRDVFMLYHFEHLTHSEIGWRLGVAVRTVEDHIARANQCLLIKLGKNP